jgi:dolichyl-phosphate-mannose-protein mannosyltransferase
MRDLKWGVICLLSAQVILVGWIGWRTSPNRTEMGHMGATVYFWQTLHFDVFHVNPPLTRMVSGIPILACRPQYDWSSYSRQQQDRPEWAMGRDFVAANTIAMARRSFLLARWALIPLLVLGGYSGYRLSRELYGEAAAFVFLTLWCISPFMLGWGATMCPDAVAGAMGLVAIYTFRRFLQKADWSSAAVAGIFLGLLPLTKLTWIIAFGVWPLIWSIWTVPCFLTKSTRRPLPSLRQLVVVLVVGLYVLNMGYLFRGTLRPLGEYVFVSELLSGRETLESQQSVGIENRFAGTWAERICVPLPADFVRGIDAQRFDFERGLPSYLRGQWENRGWWYYYLYALAVKLPLGTWCLAALALGATVFRQEYSAAWRDEVVVLVPALAILIVVSSQTGFSVHSRYIVPALPLIFVWISKVGRVFAMPMLTGTRRIMAGCVVLSLTWSVASSMAIYPHSLSYFNELAGVLPTPADASYPTAGDPSNEGPVPITASTGPLHGPRHLLESNIDWGQDLYYLEDWYNSHPQARPFKVAYWGEYPLEQSRFKSVGLPPALSTRERIAAKPPANASRGPMPGWHAVSVSYIYGRDQGYRYFHHFTPSAKAGYSIYIYHITFEEANRVRRELGLPELSEEWKEEQEGTSL